MICVIQRVISSSVKIKNSQYSKINDGILVLSGFSKDDGIKDIDWMCDKIINLRIFSNNEGKFDLSVKDIDGEILVVSQFTILGDAKKGRRPDFTNAMEKERAKKFYDNFVEELKKRYKPDKIKTGMFQQEMIVSLENDGPVTIIVNSR